LDRILQENGSSELIKALTSVLGHLDYYESLGHGKLNGIRLIYEQYYKLIKNNDLTLYPEEDKSTFTEGKTKQVYVNIYERDQNARKKCIEFYGYKCIVCGILLSDKYGLIGQDFIHVHHIKELSTIKKEYTVNPIDDLRPLCPNCHAMIHRRVPAYSIEELQEKIR
jgi:5-methylcytosine-specific restriction protein A